MGQISALRTWYGWLTDQGDLPTDPAARIKRVGSEPISPREGRSRQEIDALLEQAQHSREGARNTAILQVLLHTGMRLGECCVLTYGDVTLGEHGGMVHVRPGKGHPARSVPLSASVCEAIACAVAPRLSIEQPTLAAVAARWPRPPSAEATSPLWLSQKGGALTTSAMAQMIAELVEAAGGRVPAGTSAQTLRQTFARQYLARCPHDLVGLAHLLGLRSLETARRYGEPSLSP